MIKKPQLRHRNKTFGTPDFRKKQTEKQRHPVKSACCNIFLMERQRSLEFDEVNNKSLGCGVNMDQDQLMKICP